MSVLEEAPAQPLTIGMLNRLEMEQILREWQKRMNLSHWRIEIRWDEKPESDEEAEAEFVANDHYDSASIRLTPKWADWDRREANVTLVHELVHFTLRDMVTSVNHLESRFAKTAWELWHGWFEAGHEKATEHLAQVLVDLAGVV